MAQIRPSVLVKYRCRTETNSCLTRSLPKYRRAGKLLFLVTVLIGAMTSSCFAGVQVIGHEDLQPMDSTLLRRIYTGRVVQVQRQAIQPVNQKTGSTSRALFIASVIKQNDDDYIAYWIVRRAIGKGVPPLELVDDAQVVDFVRANPGAIGYIDSATAIDGVRVLLLLP